MRLSQRLFCHLGLCHVVAPLKKHTPNDVEPVADSSAADCVRAGFEKKLVSSV